MDVRHHEPNAATFFNGFAETFDTIYDQKRNVFMCWVDRSDIFIRYALWVTGVDPAPNMLALVRQHWVGRFNRLLACAGPRGTRETREIGIRESF